MPATAETKSAAAPLADSLRRHDRDRYLMALFAPAERREAVMALYAFNFEIARIRETVSQPVLGQIRLQWWREGLDAAYTDAAVRKHEVLTPLSAAIRGHGLSREPFERLIDARERDLTGEPPPSLTALEAYAEESSAPLQLLVLQILGVNDAAAIEAVRDAAISFALSGLLRATPFLAARGWTLLPNGTEPEAVREIAGRAEFFLDRARVVKPPRRALPALLPAVLAAADLKRLRRAHYDVFAPSFTRPDPWRSWYLTLAALTGRY